MCPTVLFQFQRDPIFSPLETVSLLCRMTTGRLLQLLPLLLLLRSSAPAEGCQETAWSNGRLTPDLGSFSLASRNAPSCVCCALCHDNPNCASLSFSPNNQECQLYSSVAGYDTLTLGGDWKYFVMPNRSQHHQFCRQDSDCRAAGDSCRGRVCTDLTAVTCRVIHETFGAGDRYGGYVSGMFGWLADAPVKLACKRGPGFDGFSRLLRSPRGFQFDRQTIMDHNMELAEDVVPHSMLRLAEHIRQSRTEPTYRMKIYRSYLNVDFEVPRSEPVVSDAPRPGIGSIQASSSFLDINWELSLPYLPVSGPVLVSTNADAGGEHDGVVAREDGDIHWGNWQLDILYFYIRE